MLKNILLVIFLLRSQASLSQDSLYNPAIDVLHYTFHVQLSDANDSLYGRAVITVRFTKKTNTVHFDLVNINDTARGMTVTRVKANGKALPFTHRDNTVTILLPAAIAAQQVRKYEISYKGIPADGLIISKNGFNHRTFFSDNWPNRARNWIPCKDHPSDKATVDFIVTAPSHYRVVSNGVRIKEQNLSHDLHLTHWKEAVPLSTKIMVIGVADFAVDHAGDVNGIPVSSWVFPEQKENGFYDYAQAIEILPYYIKHIGPYPYEKLANVQSKTIFGGMENAGAIFYFEESITGTRHSEALLAHEIAHQWFGDDATETDWPHIWLSEGFATEMTHLYFENKYGKDTLIKSLQKDRQLVIDFTKEKKVPVVDTGKNIMLLLNTNSYQKGGWILQMLRNQLGDPVFWKAVRKYYATYRGRNASTRDLQKIFEKVSGKKLQTFFTQWLYTPENPTLQIAWSYNKITSQLALDIEQQTRTTFVFPIDIQVTDKTGNKKTHTVRVTKKTTRLTFFSPDKPGQITPDPDCRLLFEGTVTEK